MGLDVVGQEVSGAELRGAGRHWGNIPGAERRGAGGQWGRTSWGRASLGQYPWGRTSWGRRSVGQDVLGQNFVGQDVAGAKSLGQVVMGQKVLGQEVGHPSAFRGWVRVFGLWFWSEGHGKVKSRDCALASDLVRAALRLLNFIQPIVRSFAFLSLLF